MESLDAPRLRVGLLSAYFGMFENVLGPAYSAEQLIVVGTQRALLSRQFDVVELGVATTAGASESIAAQVGAQRLDALVVAPTMVAPPEWLVRIVSATPAPLVLWSNSRTRKLPTALDHRIATADTALVGSVMLANCLRREGREFVAVEAAVGDADEESRLCRVVRAAATAGRLRGAVAVRVGTPLPGYRDVEATDAELGLLGVHAVDVTADEFSNAVKKIRSERAEALWKQLGSLPAWRIVSNAKPERSLRVAIALADLVAETGASLGAVNCHGSCFRDHPDVGVTACLGVTLCQAAGVPLACTGDLPAAIAGFIARSLTGTSQYCELYVRERDSDQVFVAAGGEGDPAWADDAGVQVFHGDYYPGRGGNGLAVRFRLRPGPATLISATPGVRDWRMIWATGKVHARSFDSFDGPHAAFSFDTPQGSRALEAWIEAGPTHHPYLARGTLDVELPVVARFLHMEQARV